MANKNVERKEDILLKKMAFYLKVWKSNPLLYVLDCVGDEPTYQQAEILTKLPRDHFVAVRSGHGIGKTRLFGWVTNWYLDCHGSPGGITRVPITGAGGSQLESTVFPEIEGVCDRKIKFLSEQYTKITGKIMLKGREKTHFAVMRTARKDNPDALQGFHDCFFLIDEGSGVDDKIFEVARGAMGDPNSYGLMAGNPTKTSGYFFNLWDTPQKTWRTLNYSSLDTLYDNYYEYKYVDIWGDIKTRRVRGRQTEKWVNEMKSEYGEGSNTYRIRVLGEFANEGMDLVIEPDWVKDLNRNEPVNTSEEKRVMGIDIARSGSDKCAVFIRKGRLLEYAEEWSGPDSMVSLERIKLRQAEWQCDEMIIDGIGMGGVIYDHLRKLNYPVYYCDVREVALEPNSAKCKIVRDSLWWLSRKFFKEIRPVAGPFLKADILKKLSKELCYPTYLIDKYLEVETKKDMLKRGLKSPNIADACNMTFFRDRLLRKNTFYKKKKVKKKKKRPLNFKCA